LAAQGNPNPPQGRKPMTKKALLFAAVLAGCLGAACAQMAPKSGYGTSGKPTGSRTQQATSAAVCSASPCTITIAVHVSGPECTIEVDPDILVVKGVQNALIEWNLDAPDRFRIVSLAFKDEDKVYFDAYRKRIATPSGKQFNHKHVNARKADVTDENSIDGAWYYGITVSDGPTTCKLDPPIINGE
jgi:hypothetical protein